MEQTRKTKKSKEEIETVDVMMRITLSDVLDRNVDNVIIDVTQNIKEVLAKELSQGRIIPNYVNVQPEYLLLNGIDINYQLKEKL